MSGRNSAISRRKRRPLGRADPLVPRSVVGQKVAGLRRDPRLEVEKGGVSRAQVLPHLERKPQLVQRVGLRRVRDVVGADLRLPLSRKTTSTTRTKDRPAVDWPLGLKRRLRL